MQSELRVNVRLIGRDAAGWKLGLLVTQLPKQSQCQRRTRLAGQQKDAMPRVRTPPHPSHIDLFSHCSLTRSPLSSHPHPTWVIVAA
jgi:hypothetical protein